MHPKQFVLKGISGTEGGLQLGSVVCIFSGEFCSAVLSHGLLHCLPVVSRLLESPLIVFRDKRFIGRRWFMSGGEDFILAGSWGKTEDGSQEFNKQTKPCFREVL